jgi:hypothetical protein
MEIGGFDRGVGIFHDWNVYLRIALRNPVGYVREPLSGYRCHLENASVRFESPAAHAQELMRALRGLFRGRPGPRRGRSGGDSPPADPLRARFSEAREMARFLSIPDPGLWSKCASLGALGAARFRRVLG